MQYFQNSLPNHVDYLKKYPIIEPRTTKINLRFSLLIIEIKNQ